MIRIATRRSPLAKWQANHVADLLRARSPASSPTARARHEGRPDPRGPARGGRRQGPLREGDRGRAPRRRRGDRGPLDEGPPRAPRPVARHRGGAQREDPRDALCSPRYKTLAGLPKGARVGTSSLRRSAQLKALRPDLHIEVVRGNVETRLRKASEELDAVVLRVRRAPPPGPRRAATYVFPAEEMLLPLRRARSRSRRAPPTRRR